MPFRARPESGQVRRLVADERERASGLTADRPEVILDLAVPPAARELVRRASSR
jgi:hypothetical protein